MNVVYDVCILMMFYYMGYLGIVFSVCFTRAPPKTSIQHLWISVLYKVSGKIVDNHLLH